MGMFIVEKVTFGGEHGLMPRMITAWAVKNRKTGEIIGEYQQLSIANTVAASMNKV
jgi:hypothetical protein